MINPECCLHFMTSFDIATSFQQNNKIQLVNKQKLSQIKCLKRKLHMCKIKIYVMVILHGKQGMACVK